VAGGRSVRVSARRSPAKPDGLTEWPYGRDLTAAARQGDLDPVIGRDAEMARLIQIFGRKTKNNPVLIGRSGVGKTAIVEGLALRIVEGAVPTGLLGKRLVSLDLAALVAGSSFRGEFERRLKEAINLIATSQGEFLLLVDELHMIVGAGASEGGMDVGNMLKPMLARGDLKLIGASTPEEYRLRIEKDAALERRFQPVVVDPPSLADTVEILRGLRERHEIYHGVRIHDSALEAAAHLSDRYVSGRHLPDKAVDLIDEAASRLRIGIDTVPADLAAATREARRLEIRLLAVGPANGEAAAAGQRGRLEADLAALRADVAGMTAQWQGERQAIASIHQVQRELAQKKAEAARCERAGDLAGAADVEYVQLPELDRRLDAAVKALAGLPRHGRMVKAEVDAEEIAAVVSAWTGVPVARLMEGEAAKLLHMEDMMRLRVVGQDDAVRAVAGPIRRNRAGLSDGARPIGTFLSVGPTGVGKTEMARALAEFLFDDERAMVRIDMGEYQERPADRGRPAAALRRGPARRDREGAHRRVQHPAAAAGRGPADRRAWPDRRLHQHGADHDVQPGRRPEGLLPPRVHQPH
jgi:ATP-dependent Clp protease ATP-binding subunit ClpB